MGMSPRAYLRSLVTPFNAVAALLLSIGVPVACYRLIYGLSAATNLTNDYPWGWWIGFEMLCGVALAAGGFVVAGSVHLLNLERYERFVRPAILAALLGYIVYATGLLMDLGRPWFIWHPMIYWQHHSVLFEVSWCVMLYLSVLCLEFLPVVCERFRCERTLRLLRRIMIVAIVLGVTFSTMHQSSLGGLFLIMPDKIHPLWYSPFIPLFFFVSAVITGVSMGIVVNMLSRRAFPAQMADQDPAEADRLILGLGKVSCVALLVYFGLKWVGVAEAGHWKYLLTPYGYLFFVEVAGFVLVPCLLHASAVWTRSAKLTRFAAVMTVLGVVLNRLNISVVAFRWNEETYYFPSWMEFAVTGMLLTLGLLAFRWVANRFPVLCETHAGE